MDGRKSVEVACAIIEKDGLLLIAQRKPGSFLGGLWEFPGGKKKEGETLEQCLVREIQEELRIQIRPREFLRKDQYRYPAKLIHLYFYLCDWVSGVPVKADCLNFKWIKPKDLRKHSFPIGDDAMIQDLIAKEKFYFGNSVRNKSGLVTKTF